MSRQRRPFNCSSSCTVVPLSGFLIGSSFGWLCCLARSDEAPGAGQFRRRAPALSFCDFASSPPGSIFLCASEVVKGVCHTLHSAGFVFSLCFVHG